MNELILTTKKLWFASLVFLLLLLVWQWFTLGAGFSDKQTLPEPLQKFPVSNAQAAADIIIKHNLWEPDRKPGKDRAQLVAGETVSAVVDTAWQLSALALTEGKMIAFIGDKSDPASFKKYSEGDQLPDGKTVLKIEHDRVVLSVQDKVNTSENAKADNSESLFLFGRTGELGEQTSE